MISEESRTPDLVELARLSVQPAKSRDFDAMMALWADDPVWDLSPMGLGVYRGTAAVRGFFEDWIGCYELFEVELALRSPLHGPDRLAAPVGS